jgi:hypothetical protein
MQGRMFGQPDEQAGIRLSGKPLAFRCRRRYIPRLALPVTVGGAIEEQSP